MSPLDKKSVVETPRQLPRDTAVSGLSRPAEGTLPMISGGLVAADEGIQLVS